jgi:hypothetical protein
MTGAGVKESVKAIVKDLRVPAGRTKSSMRVRRADSWAVLRTRLWTDLVLTRTLSAGLPSSRVQNVPR